MYQSASLHVATIIFIFACLVVTLGTGVLRRRPGDAKFFRQRLLVCIGIVFMLIGTTLSGEPNDILAILFPFVGLVLTLIGVIWLSGLRFHKGNSASLAAALMVVMKRSKFTKQRR